MNQSSIPHKISNHSGLALAFRQKDSDTSVLVRVRPHETVNVVWPEPRLKKILQLAEIESCPLTTSNVTTLAMDMDRSGPDPVPGAVLCGEAHASELE